MAQAVKWRVCGSGNIGKKREIPGDSYGRSKNHYCLTQARAKRKTFSLSCLIFMRIPWIRRIGGNGYRRSNLHSTRNTSKMDWTYPVLKQNLWHLPLCLVAKRSISGYPHREKMLFATESSDHLGWSHKSPNCQYVLFVCKTESYRINLVYYAPFP